VAIERKVVLKKGVGLGGKKKLMNTVRGGRQVRLSSARIQKSKVWKK